MTDVAEQFGEIYDLYIEKIYRFIYLKVNNQETAEDITSKVFLRAWEAFKAPKADIKNPSAFLYQIARNAVIDHYRSQAKVKLVSTDAVAEAKDNRTGPLDMAVLSAEVDHIKKAMGGLKKDYQDVLIWHYLDDVPVTEIAQILDKKEGAVRVMLHRGLRDLKGLIKDA
jgi:RNA polymerase sigma-70 factor (ECF subfamily)